MGKETLPPSLVLLSHFLRTSPSREQVLPTAPVLCAFHWMVPEPFPLPSLEPSSFLFSARKGAPGSSREDQPLDGQESN